MGFLLKIVEGPNKGAEIALVDGVSVTLGKGDDCDIILADQTLPDEPLAIEASADGVTVGGEALAPFRVKTLGATSLAVGPADAPWQPLEWAKEEKEGQEPKGEGQKTQGTPEPQEDSATQEKPEVQEKPEKTEKRGRRRIGCIIAAAVLLLLLLGLARCARSSRASSGSSETSETGETGEAALSAIAKRYGLTLTKGEGGAVSLSGNLKTRRERLAATAESYQARPGVDLDLTDDESFRTAAGDALFTLTEGALKVAAATNRCLSIAGSAASPAALEQSLKALADDLPWMRSVDVSGVVLNTGVSGNAGNAVKSSNRQTVKLPATPSAGPAQPHMPVCGILTKPYPCLVMRDGRRIMEGATLGDSIILKIESESVTLTNSMGRIVWKP